MIHTPQSSEEQNSSLNLSPRNDQIAESSAESLSAKLDEIPTLADDTQNVHSNGIPADWDWSTFGDIRQNSSSQAEPWAGVGLSDPVQIQEPEDYLNLLDFNLKSNFLGDTAERDNSQDSHLTPALQQSFPMEKDNSASQPSHTPRSYQPITWRHTQIKSNMAFKPPHKQPHSLNQATPKLTLTGLLPI